MLAPSCNKHVYCFSALLLGAVSILVKDTTAAGCDAPLVTEGEKAVLVFHLRKDINMSSDNVYAHLRRRNDPESDIIRCFRLESLPGVHCEGTMPGYATSNVENHTIILSIPAVTRAFQDTYTLRVYVNDSPEPAISCKLTVKETDPKTDRDKLLVIVLPTVCACLLLVAIVIIFWCIRRKRCCMKNRDCGSKEAGSNKYEMSTLQKEKGDDGSSSPFLRKKTVGENKGTEMKPDKFRGTLPTITFTEERHTTEIYDFRKKQSSRPDTVTQQATTHLERKDSPPAHGYPKYQPSRVDSDKDTRRHYPSPEEKNTSIVHGPLTIQPWFFGGTTNEQAQRLLTSGKNGHGSFLVIDSEFTDEYKLKAIFHGAMTTKFIQKSDSGYYIEERHPFATVTELINFYEEQAGCLPDVLLKPCVS